MSAAGDSNAQAAGPEIARGLETTDARVRHPQEAFPGHDSHGVEESLRGRTGKEWAFGGRETEVHSETLASSDAPSPHVPPVRDAGRAGGRSPRRVIPCACIRSRPRGS